MATVFILKRREGFTPSPRCGGGRLSCCCKNMLIYAKKFYLFRPFVRLETYLERYLRLFVDRINHMILPFVDLEVLVCQSPRCWNTHPASIVVPRQPEQRGVLTPTQFLSKYVISGRSN